jgi:hypothetical protein
MYDMCLWKALHMHVYYIGCSSRFYSRLWHFYIAMDVSSHVPETQVSTEDARVAVSRVLTISRI